jgi:hypothetical protein
MAFHLFDCPVLCLHLFIDRHSSLSVVTRLWVGLSGSESRQGQLYFSSPPRPGLLGGPRRVLPEGYRGLCLQV